MSQEGEEFNQMQHDFAERINTANNPAQQPLEDAFPCLVCDKLMLRSAQISECSFCGKAETADYRCPDGHYVCEECRLSTAEQLVKKTCERTKETDPSKIADLLMKHPAIPMYGTEHHYLVSCVTLAAMRNLGLVDIGPREFDKAADLAKIPPLGSCALWGACGAAIGVGIAFSIAMRVNMMSGQNRSVVLNLVSETLGQISKLGGPGCCKGSVILALDVAKTFLTETYDVKFDETKHRCEFADQNLTDCPKERCPIYHR
jgi:hypothetical protein